MTSSDGPELERQRKTALRAKREELNSTMNDKQSASEEVPDPDGKLYNDIMRLIATYSKSLNASLYTALGVLATVTHDLLVNGREAGATKGLKE